MNSTIGHVGDGNFHQGMFYRPDTDKEKVMDCVHTMIDRAVEMDGTVTAS
jgi:D-lactate dehydrogenase (cytochrome)